MPQIKFFEIRDRATLIPAMAVCLDGEADIREDWLMKRAGYGPDSRWDAIILTHLGTGESRNDPYKWPDTRTMLQAHNYIRQRWPELVTGEVIDVEYILGETDSQKWSERFDA